ncbi:MAG: ImmA/IrrE family metallo-endopeptidase [Christensenellales bacterium]
MLNKLELLEAEARRANIVLETLPAIYSILGFYFSTAGCRPVIALAPNLDAKTRLCVLAEELGHHYTTVGDITKLETVAQRKAENYARRWAYARLISPSDFIECKRLGLRNSFEVACHLNIREDFLLLALKCYQSVYGQHRDCNGYRITFDPLDVKKLHRTRKQAKVTHKHIEEENAR